jgi:GRIP domain
LYRKKAKEIFEAQNNGSVDAGAIQSALTSTSSADAKLSYLKNLMINYLTSDTAIRDNMETAIGTVLQFSPEERKQIAAKKAARESWF